MFLYGSVYHIKIILKIFLALFNSLTVNRDLSFNDLIRMNFDNHKTHAMDVKFEIAVCPG